MVPVQRSAHPIRRTNLVLRCTETATAYGHVRRKGTTDMTTAPERPTVKTALDPELRRLAVVVVLGAIMTILDTTIVNVAINTLGRDFHTSLSKIQWVLTAYTLALAMTIPLSGWAVRRFG